MRQVTNYYEVESILMKGWRGVYIYQRTNDDTSTLILTPDEHPSTALTLLGKAEVEDGRFVLPENIQELGWTPNTPYVLGGTTEMRYLMSFPQKSIQFTAQ